MPAASPSRTRRRGRRSLSNRASQLPRAHLSPWVALAICLLVYPPAPLAPLLYPWRLLREGYRSPLGPWLVEHRGMLLALVDLTRVVLPCLLLYLLLRWWRKLRLADLGWHARGWPAETGWAALVFLAVRVLPFLAFYIWLFSGLAGADAPGFGTPLRIGEGVWTPWGPIPPAGLAPPQLSAALLELLVLLPIYVLVEETLFRGLLYGTMRARHGMWVSLLLTVAVFALLHPPAAMAVAAINGTLYTLLYEWRKSLIAPTLVHLGGNAVIMILAWRYAGALG